MENIPVAAMETVINGEPSHWLAQSLEQVVKVRLSQKCYHRITETLEQADV